jgi:hypothetical protein
MMLRVYSIMTVAAIALAPAPFVMARPTEGLQDERAMLEALVTRAEDYEAIKRVSYAFGYYRDELMVDEMLGLFTGGASVDYANGKYVGKGSLRRLFESDRFRPSEAVGATALPPNILNDHIMMRPVITIEADGRTAKARLKDWNMLGVHGKWQVESSGIYEFSYAKIEGAWKITKLAYCTRYSHPYLTSLRDVPLPERAPAEPKFYPSDRNGPDRQTDFACPPWPHPSMAPPLHYPNPGTGELIHRP